MLPVFAASHSARRLPAVPRGNLAGTFRELPEEAGMSPVAIVTASDSGIGQECAKELAENGFDLGITYRSDESGAKETLAAVEAAGGGGGGRGVRRGRGKGAGRDRLRPRHRVPLGRVGCEGGAGCGRGGGVQGRGAAPGP